MENLGNVEITRSYYQCNQCDIKSDRSENRDDHVRNSHNDSIDIACDLCVFMATNAADMDRHREAHHKTNKQNPHKDNNQGKLDDDVSTLSTEAQDIVCRTCGFVTKTTSDMDGHVKDTHSPKKVMCEHCDFQITSQEELNEHFTSKHGAN